MAHPPHPNELAVLQALAEYRFLTIGQLGALHGYNERTTRRVVQTLRERGFAQSVTSIGAGRGRPEQVLAISAQGIAQLRNSGVHAATTATESGGSDLSQIDHDLLVNWFRIRLVQMERQVPQLKAQFLPKPAAPLTIDASHVGSAPVHGLIPDGIIALAHAGLKKTLLFFLEADMGTEPITSRRSEVTDIRGKVTAYQAYFTSQGYKSFEQAFCAPLKGFRVLLLAHNAAHLHALCRNVARWPDCDFVWMTDQGHMHAYGLGAPIWRRGGNVTTGPWSILGSAMPKSMAIDMGKRSG